PYAGESAPSPVPLSRVSTGIRGFEIHVVEPVLSRVKRRSPSSTVCIDAGQLVNSRGNAMHTEDHFLKNATIARASPRVLILGGGQAGLAAARTLLRRQPAGLPLDVTVVSRDTSV